MQACSYVVLFNSWLEDRERERGERPFIQKKKQTHTCVGSTGGVILIFWGKNLRSWHLSDVLKEGK